ncbi:MAG: family 43 glycosylhydrolase [Eubacterium sp.]|nr:family 43 glycosylhydrolase [Eubacterium sp.]
MKMKRLICILMSVVLLLPTVFAFAQADSEPVLRYTFEDTSNAPSLFGNAALVYDEDKGGKVLSLDGTDGTYAEIPQGFFDGRDVMTITFDVLAKNNGGNYFTFCFGKDNEAYDFFRIRGNEIRNAITRWSWQNEHEVKYDKYNSNIWKNVALVFNNAQMLMYVDGELVSENADTTIKVSDLGTNLLSYIGKSLYSGDGYFSGLFDNFEVYDEVLSNSEIKDKAEENISALPIFRYSFEDNTVIPTLSGNAATVYDDERGSKALYLDGTDGTYAEIPQGTFNYSDKMTVLFDVKAGLNSGNFFTFAFGQDSTRYNFFRIRGTEVRNAITVDTYYNEKEVKTNAEYAGGWLSAALVFDDTTCKLYLNGTLASVNNNTGIKVSDLGENLLTYFGKSFYSGDGYFKGYFDNFEVYDSVLSDDVISEKAASHLPLLLGASVGVVVSNLDGVSGTDAHTSVDTTIDRQNKTITSIVQRRQNIKAVPVTFYVPSEDCKIYVDSKEFGTSGTLDLSSDRTVKFVRGSIEETYTLKTPTVAGNPVLPGMYADPDIDVLDGKFWIYPTTDGTVGWGGTQFHAFSSPDLVHWRDEGVILDNKDKNPGLNDKGVQIASSAWSDGNAWAPAIEEKNGKYYFYYCGRIPDSLVSSYGEGMAIGVAWADSPAGPFTASDSPIIYPKMVSDANFDFYGQVIDPSIYTENGKSYLLFGNGSAALVELNSDMKTVNTSTFKLITGLTDFRESIAVFKHENKYYFHWSCDDTGSENYHIKYGIASSLTGEVENKGILLQKDTSNGILATGHQSVIYLNGRCFIAYHRFYTPMSVGGNVGHRRETCIDEIEIENKLFSADLLKAVTPTMAGVGAIDTNGNSVNEQITYPTCTEDGKLTISGNEIDLDYAPELKATGHQMKKVTHPATCTENGYDEYTCTLCGESYRDNYTEKTGHAVISQRGATPSQYSITCKNCGETKNIDFTDYLNLTPEDEGYDELVDVNRDGIINGRDLAHLKNPQTDNE